MPDTIPGATTPGNPGSMPSPPAQRVPPGPTGPATVAPDQAGQRQQGFILATIGLSLLERAAGMLGGSMNPDGAELLSLVLKGRKRFGSAAPDLQRQEVKMLGDQVAPVPQPTPMQGQQFQDAIRRHQMSQGVPVGGGA